MLSFANSLFYCYFNIASYFLVVVFVILSVSHPHLLLLSLLSILLRLLLLLFKKICHVVANVLLRETSGEVDNAAAFVSEDDDASKAVSDIDSENKFVVIA